MCYRVEIVKFHQKAKVLSAEFCTWKAVAPGDLFNNRPTYCFIREKMLHEVEMYLNDVQNNI